MDMKKIAAAVADEANEPVTMVQGILRAAAIVISADSEKTLSFLQHGKKLNREKAGLPKEPTPKKPKKV